MLTRRNYASTQLAALLCSSIVALFLSAGSAVAMTSDLTVEIGGDLLKHGGVVTVHHIPTDPAGWGAEVDDKTSTIRLDQRYAEIQLRYPKDGKFNYRFRPVAGSEQADKHGTQVLSVIGTDENGLASPMTMGFTGVPSSGGRIIRVPSLAELIGPDEATRSNARWGVTEGFDAPPPADERSARALVAVIDWSATPIHFGCKGDAIVQVCTPDAGEWPKLDAWWWRSIAESRLERLHFHALRRCYDGGLLSAPSRCEPEPDSDEPSFVGAQ